MRQRERIPELRRPFPDGATVDNYVFQEGPANLAAGDTPARPVRLSELFSGPGRSLVIYHLMYGKRQTSPCPMCTMWIDGFNGVAPHLAQGNQDSAISVFTRDDQGILPHFYTSHPRMANDIDQRSIDLLSPVWNLLDLTLQGRGDWYAERPTRPGTEAPVGWSDYLSR